MQSITTLTVFSMAFLIMLTMLPILEPKSATPMDVKKRTPLKLQIDQVQCERFAAAAGAALGCENDYRESPNKKETSHGTIKILRVKEPAKVTMHHP